LLVEWRLNHYFEMCSALKSFLHCKLTVTAESTSETILKVSPHYEHKCSGFFDDLQHS